MACDFRALHAEPERRDLAWRYGISPEILDPVRRTAEIGNWLWPYRVTVPPLKEFFSQTLQAIVEVTAANVPRLSVRAEENRRKDLSGLGRIVAAEEHPGEYDPEPGQCFTACAHAATPKRRSPLSPPRS